MDAQTSLSITETKKKDNNPSLLKMVWQPIIEMEKITKNPFVLFPLIIVTLLYTLGTTLIAMNVDVSLIVQDIPDFDENSRLFRSIIIGSAAFSGFSTPIFNILFSSVIYYVVAKLSKSTVSFRQLFSLQTYIMFIGVIGLMLNALLLYSLHLNSIQSLTSLGSLVGNNGAFNKIEVFSIWQSILSGIGLYKVAGLSKLLSLIVVIILFVLTILSGLFLPSATF
jgi:hypothetical protein